MRFYYRQIITTIRVSPKKCQTAFAISACKVYLNKEVNNEKFDACMPRFRIDDHRL